jgi:hypothetical protein
MDGGMGLFFYIEGGGWAGGPYKIKCFLLQFQSVSQRKVRIRPNSG